MVQNHIQIVFYVYMKQKHLGDEMAPAVPVFYSTYPCEGVEVLRSEEHTSELQSR